MSTGVPDAPGLVFGTAGLGSRIAVAPPRNVLPRRVFSLGIWATEADLDRSEAERPPPEPGRGRSVRLAPIRSWQRNHPIIDRISDREHDGPVLSVTISQARIAGIPSFLRASRPAEQQVVQADGLIWAAGFAKPPSWFATISYWESSEAVTAYAHGHPSGADPSSDSGSGSSRLDGAHRRAIPSIDHYFRRSTVLRCRPYGASGSLEREPVLVAPGTTAS